MSSPELTVVTLSCLEVFRGEREWRCPSSSSHTLWPFGVISGLHMEDLCRTNSRGLGGESIVSFWQNGGKSPVVVLATDKRGPTIQFFNFLMRRAQPTHPTIRQSDGCTAYRSDVIIHLMLHSVCSSSRTFIPETLPYISLSI